MYMTRIRLDTTKRKTMKALVMPNLFHGAIEDTFRTPGKRKLWRIDTLNNQTYLLIVSEALADLGSLIRQFGVEDTDNGFAVKDYAPFLARLTDGGRWHFRLVANPVNSACANRSTADEKTARGKVYAHVTPASQKQWLISRAQKHGFSVAEGEVDTVYEHWVTFNRGIGRNSRVCFLAVTFEGVLTIQDTALFRETLTQGMGRAKAYGCGLLTIAGGISGG